MIRGRGITLGGGGNAIVVTVDSGATVYATNGTKTISGVAVDGVAKLKVKAGTWTVWAELNGDTTSEVEVAVVDDYKMELGFSLPLSSLAEGTLIQIKENGSGVPFYVAKHNYESGLNGAGRTLVARKECTQKMAWGTGKNAYAGLTLDNWLNNTYKPTLDSAVQKLIGTTTFYYTYGVKENKIITLIRSVFIPSLAEYGFTASGYNTEGSALPIAYTLQVGTINGTACAQWTRTPYTGGNTQVAYLTTNHSYSGSVSSDPFAGARPIFTLPSTAMVNPNPNADGSYTLIV